MDSQAQTLAPTDKQAKPANKAKYDRLTRTDIGLLIKLKQQGLTQSEIAQRLGCTQGTVSKWLDNLTDTREPAKEYLAGSALRMAQNIVNKGLARDHIAALNGLGVLNQQDTGRLTLIINGLALHGTAQPETVDATFASDAQIVSEDMHRLTDETGSDNS